MASGAAPFETRGGLGAPKPKDGTLESIGSLIGDSRCRAGQHLLCLAAAGACKQVGEANGGPERRATDDVVLWPPRMPVLSSL
jgi:hypothetical protein